MVDYIVLGFLAVAFIFGVIRGVVSQIMALTGLVVAYFFAPAWGAALGDAVQQELGCTRFMAEKAGILLVGVAIYISIRLLGYGIERLFVKRVSEFRKLNRVGGGIFSALKAAVMVAIIFFFIALVPRESLRSVAPKMMTSRVYRLAAEYNPMGNQTVLERMRNFRSIVQSPIQNQKLQKDVAFKRVLQRHQLERALSDHRFIHSLEEGDFDQLQQTENVEKMMKDDDLVQVLDRLSKES